MAQNSIAHQADSVSRDRRWTGGKRWSCPCAKPSSTPWRLIRHLIKHHIILTYWGSRGIVPRILNNMIATWMWESASCLGLFTPGKNPSYPLDRRRLEWRKLQNCEM